MDTPGSRGRSWWGAWAALGLFALLAYGYHVWACASSPLFYFPYVFKDSDMQVTMRWAESIHSQGLSNPLPYHPQTEWMQRFGNKAEWESWWGGPQIFQQSPLYAYLVAGFLALSHDLIYLHIAQALAAVLLCGLLGVIAYKITGQRGAGIAGAALALAYAPFYMYSFALLRDLLSWVITAALIVVLLNLRGEKNSRAGTLILATLAGLLLGVGFLARESYALVIPLVWGATFWLLKGRDKRAWAVLCITTVLAVTPLILRNHMVGAPLLSSSNRFAEAFIQGNARSEYPPYLFIIPEETREILTASGGKTWPTIQATIATHPSVWSWVAHQWSKALSLFDPFESHDNLSVSYMETISPLVKWGVKHWMIFTPGLCGLFLSLYRRDTRHWPLWILFLPMIASVLVGVPLSRYRQGIAVLWIPWAIYFGAQVIASFRSGRSKVGIAMTTCLLTGWGLSLGPLDRCPRELYDRPIEYALAAKIYKRLNQPEKARETEDFIKNKFPEFPGLE